MVSIICLVLGCIPGTDITFQMPSSSLALLMAVLVPASIRVPGEYLVGSDSDELPFAPAHDHHLIIWQLDECTADVYDERTELVKLDAGCRPVAGVTYRLGSHQPIISYRECRCQEPIDTTVSAVVQWACVDRGTVPTSH